MAQALSSLRDRCAGGFQLFRQLPEVSLRRGVSRFMQNGTQLPRELASNAVRPSTLYAITRARFVPRQAPRCQPLPPSLRFLSARRYSRKLDRPRMGPPLASLFAHILRRSRTSCTETPAFTERVFLLARLRRPNLFGASTYERQLRVSPSIVIDRGELKKFEGTRFGIHATFAAMEDRATFEGCRNK